MLAATVIITAFCLVALKGAMDSDVPTPPTPHYEGSYDDWEEAYDQHESEMIHDDEPLYGPYHDLR